MKSLLLTCSAFALTSMLAAASDPPGSSSSRSSAQVMVSKKLEQKVAPGPASYFTGRVEIAGLFQREAPSRVTGAIVTFQPKARTAWHSHPAGQTLIVTKGMGLVQYWNGPAQEIREGDIVWIPPSVKHWHGAGADGPMTHVAIQEKVDGKNVEWMEHVTDEQYSSQSH